MDRPPYKEEGILGHGGRKFIAWVIALGVVAGLGVAALNVDFGEIAHAPPEFSAGEWAQLYGGQPSIANYLFYPQPTTMISTPRSLNTRAKSTRPRLSDTDSSARSTFRS